MRDAMPERSVSSSLGKSVEIVTNDGGCVIGSWRVPGPRIDNFEAQQDLGWHVFHALERGDTTVTVRIRVEGDT